MQGTTYNATFVNELKHGEFVLVNVSVTDVSNLNLTLYYSNFTIVTSNGTYHSLVIPTGAFADLGNAGVYVNPLFQSTKSNVKLSPSFSTSYRQLIFLVPKGSDIEGIQVVEKEFTVGSTTINSSIVHYLSVVRFNIVSNDSKITVSCSTPNPIYTINDAVTISGTISDDHLTAVMELVAINDSPNFKLVVSKGLIGKELPLAQYNNYFFYTITPSSTPFSLTVYLPPGGYYGDLNFTFYFKYVPSWTVNVDSFINDTAEALRYVGPGYSYFVYNVTIGFVDYVNISGALETNDFSLVTSAGTFKPTYVGDHYLFAVSNDFSNTFFDNDTTASYQLVFLVPANAKPYYLVLNSSNGIIMDKIPVQNVKPVYFSLINFINVKNTNDSYVAFTGPSSILTPIHSGQKLNITIEEAYFTFAKNFSIVNISVTPPFKLVGVYPPNVIGKVTNRTNLQFNVEVEGPNESYYGDLNITIYVVVNVPPSHSPITFSSSTAFINVPPTALPAVAPLAFRRDGLRMD